MCLKPALFCDGVVKFLNRSTESLSSLWKLLRAEVEKTAVDRLRSVLQDRLRDQWNDLGRQFLDFLDKVISLFFEVIVLSLNAIAQFLRLRLSVKIDASDSRVSIYLDRCSCFQCSLLGRIIKNQLSNHMKTQIQQYSSHCDELMKQFKSRMFLSII